MAAAVKIGRFLLVRHGESENNVAMARIVGDRGLQEETERQWLAQRKDDPSLTNLGWRQAKAVAASLKCDKEVAAAGVALYCSPMLRCCQTASAIAEALGVPAVVQPDIFEVGGIYTAESVGGKTTRAGPGKCLSAAEINAQFPTYDTAKLPAQGGWYTGPWETNAMARVRLAAVAKWLKSAELIQQLDGRLMIMVVHGHTIDMLLKGLMGVVDDVSRDTPGGNATHVYDVGLHAVNTSTSRFDLHGDGRFTLRWFGRSEHVSNL